jgi:hypothetical protein
MIMLKTIVARAIVMVMLKIIITRAIVMIIYNNHPGDCNDYAENSSRPGCVQPWLCAPTTLPSNR